MRVEPPRLSESNTPAASTLQFLAGGGEMGARIREFDWSNTPLGPPDGWPQSLRSTLSMLLPSKAQIILFWGPEFVVFYNDAYRPVFGAKHPFALGLPGRKAWSEIWDSQLHGLLAGVVRTGEAFWAKDLLFEIERFGFLEETYFDVSYDPVRDESGDVGGVFCIVTETTERVVGERRMALLKDLAARNAAARTAHDACVLATETLAARPQDITFALSYLDDVLQCSTPGAEEQLAQSSRAHTHAHSLVPSGAGGRSGKLVVGLNPRRPFDDAYRSFVELVADQVSTAVANAVAHEEARKRADALAEIDRVKTAFFSNVSHEFRTPLTLMLGPIENLLAEVNGPLTPAQHTDLEILRRNSNRLLKLVNELLDFTRLEAGRAQASYTATDISLLTRELAGTFRSAIEQAGIGFDVECEPIAERVYVDRGMWETVVLNLLSNALKFTFAGAIRVGLASRPGAVELTVTDTGTGIPEQELPRIFERFHRVEGVKSRTHEGTGIGLALAHELVQLHGGTITAESREGEGTTFVVRIPTGRAHLPEERIERDIAPVTADAIATAAAPFVDEAERWLPAPRPAAPPCLSARERVLVVDDNADMRDYLCHLLRDWDVTTAADGETALEQIRANPPDLVVSDVMMPGLDGFGLLRALRDDPRTKAIPVLMVSARAGEEARVSGLGAGADDYVVKPFSARELTARVGSLLNLSRARREAEIQRAAAEAANNTKDEFLAILGHELRNPLAPILTALQLMTLRGDGTSTKERAVIDRQVRHLVRLVDDLLDVSRIAQGKIELRRQSVDIAELVASAIEAASPALEERQHELQVDVPRGLAVLGDPIRLSQVVVNILSNAAKYTEPRGRIRIQAQQDGSQIELRIRDSGIGIAPEMLHRVFEMFTQERQAIDRSQGGLGLGLTIAKSLVELHEGTIEAASAGVGKGSEFVIRLPAISVAAGALKGPAAGRPERSASNSRRILVVDDNVDAALMIADALKVFGHEVHVAFDGPAALAAAAEFRPHAALLDLGLPLMDGYELAAQLVAAATEPRPMLVAVTGYGQVSDRDRTRAAGFDAHVVKPVDVPQLVELLERLLKVERAR